MRSAATPSGSRARSRRRSSPTRRGGAAGRARECARDPDPVVREALAVMLREVKPEGAAATLEALANDADAHVRRAAREARENIVESNPRSGPPQGVRGA